MTSDRKWGFWLIVGALWVGMGATGATAQTPSDSVPPDLRPWIPWVLAQVPDRNCTVTADGTVCVWEGRLALSLDESGGPFTQQVVTDRDGWLALPGDDGHWPEQVRVDGRQTVVVRHDGHPAVRLASGEHRIDGRFVFDRLPEVLAVPPAVALVDLTLSGKAVAFPRRDADGTLWLRRRDGSGEGETRLDVEVARKLADGVPMRITTRLDLNVGGRPREVDLGEVGVPDTVPISVQSEIPAHIDARGHLIVQVVAGVHTVEVDSRVEGDPKSLSAPRHAAPWPSYEVWVWQGDPDVRQVDLRGPPAIDPDRTQLTGDWAKLPAYVMKPGAKLTLVTLRRGEPEPPPNHVTLARELWMDLDGSGYTVRDRLGGQLHQDWRLDLTADGHLGHVSVGGDDRLITIGPRSKRPGVELRRSDLDMTAEWRTGPARGDLPAVGWSTDVQKLSWNLHLPPGWSVLWASGVDEAPGTWIGSWDLWDFFFVLIVALAVARLFGWVWGLCTLVLLVLCQQETGAPEWVWPSLILAVALLRVLPRRHWTRWVTRAWWWGSLLALVVVTVPYAVHQLREALHPQVGGRTHEASFVLGAAAPMLEEGAPPPGRADLKAKADEAAAEAENQIKQAASASSGETERYASSAFAPKIQMQEQRQELASLQQDPNAVIQTGPGVPDWHWQSWSLGWSGPVEHNHRISLWLIGPVANGLLALLRVALIVLLGAMIFARSRPRAEGTAPPGSSSRPPPGTAATVAALLLSLGLLGTGAAARAQPPNTSAMSSPATPTPSVLDQLRQRLTKPAACRPDCVAAPSATLAVKAGRLTIDAQVDVAAPSSFRVPGPAEHWVPDTVSLDGKATPALALRDDGYIHIRIPVGVHRVELAGPIQGDALTLQLPDPVHRLTVSGAGGWDVDGVGKDGQVTSSLRLTRVAPLAAGAGERGAALPPWLHVERTLDAGVSWRMHTVVRRVSPGGTPVLVRIPLVEGESVERSDIEVKDGHAIVTLSDQDDEVDWWSSLEPRPAVVLTAPKNVPWTETWRLSCGVVWHCQVGPRGKAPAVPPVQHVVDGSYEPTFEPWPGESVTMRFLRPDAAKGRSVTIDSATLEVDPGVRLEQSTLTLRARSSSGGVQKIGLPKGARIQGLTVDGNDRPFEQHDRTLQVGLDPGSQTVELHWQQPQGMGMRHAAPRVDLGSPAANVRVRMHVPPERWLLAVGGPPWGPAILFWSFLLATLVFAWLLSRVPGSPLRAWQWLLLAAGLTQVHVIAALIVVGWFFALALRRDHPAGRPALFDLTQILLALGTLVTLGVLYYAVQQGLLVQPDMQVAGAGSTQTDLHWYVDRTAGALPMPVVWSVPLWVYKVLMLLWSLWLAWSLVRWLPWAWRCFSDGGWWKRLPRKAVDRHQGDVGTQR